MNKSSTLRFSVLFLLIQIFCTIPSVLARTQWTQQPPFPDAYADAWRGDHWPERETWWARASADETTGIMEANIHSYMDVGGYLNTFFETAMIDQVSISTSGTLYISGVVFLKGHAHIYGIAVGLGGYTAAYTLELWLIVDDTTSGTNLLEWKVNTWEDSETALAGWVTDRGYDFDFDYSIAQTSMPVIAGHTYSVTVKLAGWAGATAVGIAASQADIDFESDDYLMKLKWLSYDAPSGDGNGGGGCPFISTWNGTNFELDNNLLALSEVSHGSDVVDYYLLQKTLAQKESGSYQLLLSEFENEHSYLDRLQLFAVDHNSNANVAVGRYGQILTYTEPSSAVSAIDDNHKNVKHILGAIDSDYYEGYNGSHVTLNFGDELDVTEGAKLVMRADFPEKEAWSIHVQVQDEGGNWNTVATVIPRVHWATEIVDLSEHLPDAHDNLKVRLYFTADHKVDFVGLDTSPQATIDVYKGQMISGVHSAEGNITASLLCSDDVYAELVPEQEIILSFTLPPQTLGERSFLLVIEGHYYRIPT